MSTRFERSSIALPLRRPCTSGSATAGLDFPKALAKMKTQADRWKSYVEERGGELYSLDAIVGSNPELPANSYESLRTWISKELRISPTNVSCNTEVKEFKEMIPIFTSTNIRPDVSVYRQNIPVLCIEVHSSPYEQSINKMVWVLIEHLRWLRNQKTTIAQCVGFVFPKFEVPSSVIKVRCCWNAKALCFDLEYVPLLRQEVAEEVRSVYATTEDMCKLSSKITYGIPLCEKTLEEFGENSSQLSSHFSFVIQNNDLVYKYAFDSDGRDQVLRLYHQVLRGGEVPERYLLPQGTIEVGEKMFMTYKRLLHPLSSEEVRSCFRAFIESVCEALYT